ncbi:bifunctional glutamate N-acetyltransferase/amino-acid acetyltransferase ArgJ [Serpentinicella sp. ANB-PHB4]|uniref:bifunctional glutamate N-acetyltransferase/amino-acid acetyltransferase ArgJ n=1 Tax=Serpentinicella sp. ANB-PHB4 TaxID=3074076 RepID=UPI00285A801F|nr:bifunctional glutamate N-acetyltransferase/amino-acid acetyltransferase ArgJ [Serpentinicella sp. ANB-PHB4]MDR5659892.1 bifunctional glutamate N-acetyltransferase/amino-acid acetyltransferase ArgJ [Serpentinicella sp. ANB-PHB4]
MKNYKIIEGDVTSPKGYKASGVHTGIKKKMKDMTLILSDVMASTAALFTTNKVCAAPVTVSREHIKNKKAQAIIVNSGNANACTGDQGQKDAESMAEKTAEVLNIPKEAVIVSSTGVIGVSMPMETVMKGIETAADALSYNGGQDAAEGILTTDTGKKNVAVEVEIDDKKVTIGGIAKGSGMIHPNMATMLAFVTTDANIDSEYLDQLLKDVTKDTYNMISVDGDTSTNDMVCAMANGLAENETITAKHKDKEKFIEAFKYVHEYLAKSIVKDGEGATKFIEVTVKNSATKEDARKSIKSILNSSLVKTAIFGEDGNWGRIVCAIGYSEANFTIENTDVTLESEGGRVTIFEKGQGTDYEEDDVAEILKYKEIKILVDFNEGDESATGWGCDLSYDYVKINGAYRT